MIRPYLRNLINDHKTIMELNTNTNTNNTNTNTSTNDNSNRVEWKIQLIMQNNFISVKDFQDTCTIY